MRWPILAGLGLLATPTPALADDPLYACAKAAPDAKLTIQLKPDLTLRELGAWVTGFTCKSVIYDAEAAARATKLAPIAARAVTPKQAVQRFVDAVQKAGLVVAEQPDAFVLSLPAAVQRRCPAQPSAPSASAGVGACVRATSGATLELSVKPDATLDELAVWLTAVTCKQVSFDPKVAAQAIPVNLIVSARVTQAQATRLFAAAAESAGLVVAERPDVLEVSPGPRWSHCAPAPDVDAVLDAGIRKLDDTHYEVKGSAADKILADPVPFTKSVRVVPAMKDGKPIGFKIYAVRPTSLLARLGFQNGDTIQEINGQRLDSADQALAAYSKLQGAKKLEIVLLRRGRPMTIAITAVK